MAQADWKRYFAVVYDRKVSVEPLIFKNRKDAVRLFERERRSVAQWPNCNLAVPIGIVRLRGNKRNPQVQRWLLENAK